MKIEIYLSITGYGGRSTSYDSHFETTIPRIGERITIDSRTGVVTDVRHDYTEKTVYVEAKSD